MGRVLDVGVLGCCASILSSNIRHNVHDNTSPTTSKTHDFKTTPATKGLELCLDATQGIKAHRSVLVNTHGTPMPAREGRG